MAFVRIFVRSTPPGGDFLGGNEGRPFFGAPKMDEGALGGRSRYAVQEALQAPRGALAAPPGAGAPYPTNIKYS